MGKYIGNYISRKASIIVKLGSDKRFDNIYAKVEMIFIKDRW